MAVTLTHSYDIVANSVSVVCIFDIVSIRTYFFEKNEVAEDIFGLPPATLNTLQKLA